MITGFVSVASIKLADGKFMSTQRAVDLGWIKPSKQSAAGWGIPKENIPLGSNTFVDNGRQLLAYLFGGRTPVSSYVCSRFGVGTGNSATHSAYTDLESPVEFYDNGGPSLIATKPIANFSFPSPMIAQAQLELGLTEAVGILITELGLYASDADGSGVTLVARKTNVGIAKNSDFAPVLLWQVRF